jgi:hypothetical protein
MDIGIGLPSTIPGIPGRLILQWASAAEQAGFSSLGTLDRIVYSNLETVPSLAAAAASPSAALSATMVNPDVQRAVPGGTPVKNRTLVPQ